MNLNYETMPFMIQDNPFSGEHFLQVIPLGGVEEIGLNCTVFRYGDHILVVDAGIMFPDDEMPGVDFVIPDFSYLKENRDMVRGIAITHGHEDHTGALPFLLREVGEDVPVFGTPLSIGMIREKLKEYRIRGRLVPVRPRSSVPVGPFVVEFVRVTHSIVDGAGLGIHTPLGLVVHTGDFKIDPTPVDGELLDFGKFSEFGDNGTLLLMSDSTNAEKGGFTFSEKEVLRAFESILFSATGRIIVATFASNIHRIQQIVDVACKYGRKVSLCGKSLVSNAGIALDLGYLKMPENTWVRLDEILKLPDKEVVIITTGSQGEPMSVLSRIATDEHKTIKIRPDDTVILSSKMIPGNERSIGKIINHLFKRGANVIYEKVSEVHVSGHASKEELKLMLNLVRPRYFMPIHGEFRHLVYHAQLAEKVAIPRENIFFMQDGEVLEIDDGSAGKNGKVVSGRVFIDGKGDIEDVVLRDRRKLAHDGILLVIMAMEKTSGNIASGPDIVSRGFVPEEASAALLEDARRIVADTVKGLEPDMKQDVSIIKAKIRSVLKRFIYKTIDRRPMIVPIIFEI